MPKVLYKPFSKSAQAENANFVEIYEPLYDQSGTTIPKLLYHYVFKVRGKTCNVKFSLHHIGSGDRRIFQIELYDRNYPSHREGKDIWLGPHMFYDGRARRTASRLTCSDEHRERWFNRFCRHTNITVLEAPGSYQRELL